MEQEIAFETSAFGGFNKKSVLKYIDELGEQNRSVVEGLERQLAEAQAKNQELAGAVETLNAKVKQVEQESAQKAAGLEQTVAELREDLAQQHPEGAGSGARAGARGAPPARDARGKSRAQGPQI